MSRAQAEIVPRMWGADASESIRSAISNEYLESVVKRLAAVGSHPLGFRVAGTPEEHAAVQLVSAELDAFGYEPIHERVPVDAWRPLEEALAALRPRAEPARRATARRRRPQLTLRRSVARGVRARAEATRPDGGSRSRGVDSRSRAR